MNDIHEKCVSHGTNGDGHVDYVIGARLERLWLRQVRESPSGKRCFLLTNSFPLSKVKIAKEVVYFFFLLDGFPLGSAFGRTRGLLG